MSECKKLFFFDIDGTIRADETGYIPESTIHSIKKLRENGHKVFINTGRTASNVGEDIRSIGFDGYVFGCGTEVFLNGARIYRKSFDPVFCMKLAKEICLCGASPVYERSDVLLTDGNARVIPAMQELLTQCIKGGASVVDINSAPDTSYDKFVIWYDEQTDMNRFRRLIEGKFAYIDRGYGFAEMIPAECSKAYGMEKILCELGASSDDAVAFGDSLNDAEMLSFAGVGIAMGGAEALYPYADCVTKELNDNGIEFALKKNGWI